MSSICSVLVAPSLLEWQQLDQQSVVRECCLCPVRKLCLSNIITSAELISLFRCSLQLPGFSYFHFALLFTGAELFVIPPGNLILHWPGLVWARLVDRRKGQPIGLVL